MEALNTRFKQEGGNVYDSIPIPEKKDLKKEVVNQEKDSNWKKQILHESRKR